MTLRLAIIRLSAVGDLVHGLPLAISVRRRYPRAEIVWITQAKPAELLSGHPAVDRVLVFPRRGRAGEILRFLCALPGERFSMAIDLQGNLKSALVLAATLAPVRLGLPRREVRESLGTFAANRRAGSSRGPHSVDRTLTLARALGDPAPLPRYDLFATEAGRAGVRGLLPGGTAPLVAVSVGAGEDIREWTDAAYLRVAGMLRARGVRVLFLSGPDQRDRAERLAGEAGTRAIGGDLDLKGLVALLDALAKRGATALLGCDSAPAHLAVAVGLPLVFLAGPQDPARTGPYGTLESVVQTSPPPPCAPCRKRTCRNFAAPRVCMTGLDPEEVVGRLLRILSVA